MVLPVRQALPGDSARVRMHRRHAGPGSRPPRLGLQPTLGPPASRWDRAELESK